MARLFPNATFDQRRVAVAIALAILVLAFVNYAAGWGLVGSPDRAKLAVLICAALLLAVLHWIGPTMAEVQAYSDQRLESLDE